MKLIYLWEVYIAIRIALVSFNRKCTWLTQGRGLFLSQILRSRPSGANVVSLITRTQAPCDWTLSLLQCASSLSCMGAVVQLSWVSASRKERSGGKQDTWHILGFLSRFLKVSLQDLNTASCWPELWTFGARYNILCSAESLELYYYYREMGEWTLG